MSKPVNPRDRLIAAGLLPNPAARVAEGGYVGLDAVTSTFASAQASPLVGIYEENLHTLAERVGSLARLAAAAEAALARCHRDILRRGAALEWVRNEYELDELALEILAHALGETGS